MEPRQPTDRHRLKVLEIEVALCHKMFESGNSHLIQTTLDFPEASCSIASEM